MHYGDVLERAGGVAVPRRCMVSLANTRLGVSLANTRLGVSLANTRLRVRGMREA